MGQRARHLNMIPVPGFSMRSLLPDPYNVKSQQAPTPNTDLSLPFWAEALKKVSCKKLLRGILVLVAQTVTDLESLGYSL